MSKRDLVTKKRFFVTLLAAAGFVSAQASAQVTPDQLAGTWECFGPGQTSAKTPPILHFGVAKEGVEVDGFMRAVQGPASVAADAGATKVTPATGSPFFITGYASTGNKVSMQVRRDGVGNYRCHRLPRYDNVMIPRDKVIEAK